MLETLTIEPRTEHQASVIWLHGLGADGHDFEPIVPELKLPENAGIRFIFPHAPMRPVTVNSGYMMRAWYDLRSLQQINADEDIDGIEESAQQVQQLLEAEMDQGIDSKKIILAGFSQGGVIALHLGLCFKQPLAGIMALSTYLASSYNLEQRLAAENRNVAIFMAHGVYDDVVPMHLGIQSRSLLETLDYHPEWHDYPVAHGVHPDEINTMANWLTRCIC